MRAFLLLPVLFFYSCAKVTDNPVFTKAEIVSPYYECPTLGATEIAAVTNYLLKVRWQPYPNPREEGESLGPWISLKCVGRSAQGKETTVRIQLDENFVPEVRAGLGTAEYQTMSDALGTLRRRTQLKTTDAYRTYMELTKHSREAH